MTALTVLDLFSAAAGGWSLGMHRAGFKTIAACESVAWRRELYAVNNPDVRIYDDVRTLTADHLVRDLGRLPDVIVGSPPCQDISAANANGLGVDGAQSRLFFEAIRLIGEVRPRWFALENSDRVRTRGYDRIAAALDLLGYSFWPLVVGAGHAGAAHLRKRVWIIGMDANAASSEGRLAGQPWVDPNTHGLKGQAPGSASGRWQRRPEALGGVDGRLAADANRDDVRLEQGWSGGSDGENQTLAWLDRVFRGPTGSQPLGRHLRAYDGLPAGLAEQCREAFGDAVLPQIPEAIGRAILRTEAALAAVYGAAA